MPKSELKRMIRQCQSGHIADCRFIVVLDSSPRHRGRAQPSYIKVIGFGPRM